MSNSFEYVVSVRTKYFDSEDTVSQAPVNCQILKVAEDTIIGFHARVFDYNHEKLYNAEAFYLVNKKEKKIMWDEPSSGKQFTRLVKNNIGGLQIPSFLIRKEPFEAYIDRSIKITYSGIKMNNRKKCHIITFLFQTDEEITFADRDLYIDVSTGLPVKIISRSKFKNIQDEYIETVISKLKIGVKFEKFTASKYPGYAFEQIKARNFVPVFLANGDEAVPFKLRDINGNQHEINAQKTKLIMLDFWYLACAPCLKAIPEIVSLRSEYGEDKIEIYGINSYDSTDKRVAEIKRFVKEYNINYPLLIADNLLVSQYKVNVWPTIYLIQDGRIVYSHLGYDKTQFDILRGKIKELIAN
jgi:thiol-disulfide isomerase/thioredoxin